MNTTQVHASVSGQESRATYLPKHEGVITFPLDRTVLLVIDPVNDFLSEGGAAWEMTKTTVKMNGVIENLRRAIEGARAAGIAVIFGPMAYTEEDYADEHLHHRCGINRLMFERKMFTAGSWGADFHPDLKPLDYEIVLSPHKGTDVFETDLPEHLRQLGTTHLIIAGMTANLCCESTGRRATEEGFDVTFLKDAIGSEDLLSYEAAVKINYPLIGNAVLSVDDLLAAFDSAARSPIAITAGDTVCGSDGDEIGEISQVVETSDNHPGYIVVPRGILFEKDTYIPLDAVIKRAGGKVFINLPKMVVGKMPWDMPPTTMAQQEKYGPPSSRVDNLYLSRNPTGPH
ncbi:MAG: isochorismatase family protein [Methylobacter sp.]|uniref:isochorismatase family protein n=1 Tax=Methylobacter sp. TaxID=2051955 RepID=UPI00258E866B|nr:isochorismatase family protein [Methylobacter sp.]MCL7419737.1 isochorismatase family protein [Methylobacter sp.]